MPSTARPDLANADGVEVTDYLLPLGWSEIFTNLDETETALVVEATGTRDLDADLDGFTPTAPRGEYVSVPAELKPHKEHLKAYLDAERDGSMDAADPAIWRDRTSHALADVIAWIRKDEKEQTDG